MNSNHTKIVSKFALFCCNRFSMDDLWSMILCRSVCKRPDKVFPLDSNKQLTVYISAWRGLTQDWKEVIRWTGWARWPGQWPQFDWDKRETMARFSKQQHPLEFCDQIKRGLVLGKWWKKAGLWYAALNKQLVGHREVSSTAEEWSRRSWGQAVASLIGCTQTGVNHQGWVWQKQVSKNKQNCGV